MIQITLNETKTVKKNRKGVFHPEDIVISKSIHAMPHPTHYLIHKYWSRKPHNVVREYIKNFTKQNDLILDPFMGSGVTAIESSKIHRRAIGVDINPMSAFITKGITKKVNLAKYHEEFYKIYQKAEKELLEYYVTSCPVCGRKATTELQIYVEKVTCSKCNNAVRLDKTKRRGSVFYCPTCGAVLVRGKKVSDEVLLKVRGYCKNCRTFKKNPDSIDFEKIEYSRKKFDEYKKTKKIWFPKCPIADFVRRSGKTKLSELFSERALICLSMIRNEIEKIEDKDIKDLMFLTFTSMLSNVSKLIPGDAENVRGRSGWQISKFHVLPIHTEKNVLLAFKDRYNLIKKGKKETNKEDIYLNTKLYVQSSEDLSFIENETIDYIFTDPPYGDSIPYLGLSHLWNSWMKFNVDYENEIIYDKTRGKNLDNYKDRLTKVFKECYRVLKTNHFMSLTFNTRDLKIWGILLTSCKNAGFELINVVHQPQAVSSATQGLNWKNTLKGDFIYNFIKQNNKRIQKDFNGSFDNLVINETKKIILKKQGATTSDVFIHLIPVLVNKNAIFSENNGKNIEKTLSKNFNFKKVEREKDKNRKNMHGFVYKWFLKEGDGVI